MHPFKSPQTAPVASSTRFPFDPPTSPRSVRTCEKNQTLFTFDDYKNKDRKSSTESSGHDSSNTDSEKRRSIIRKERYSNSKHGHQKQTSGYSKKDNDKNSTMFPFDREAIDYERIQRECFAIEDETQFTTHDFHHIKTKNYDKQSQYYDQLRSPSEIFHQYTLLTHEEKTYRSSKYDRMSPVFQDHHFYHPSQQQSQQQSTTSPRSTSPVPDFRVDYFSEPTTHPIQSQTSFTAGSSSSSSSAQQDDSGLASSQNFSNNGSCGSVIVHTTNNIMSNSGGIGSSSICTTNMSSSSGTNSSTCTGGGGPINVTSNPMDTAVYTQPRATIVVQQVN